MALILNIETSTEVCSVSLSKNGETLYLKESTEGLNHAELTTVFIEDLFKENNIDIKTIDAVAVSKGPGSYTGLRIGVSVAKGLCYALNIPLISVNSLEALAVHTAENAAGFSSEPAENLLFCPMIDARRMEVFTALYDGKGQPIKPVSAEIIESGFLSDILEKQPVLFFGNGAGKCKEKIQHPNACFAGPEKTSAQFMQKISEHKYNNREFENVAYFEPFYLKNFVATIPKNKII